MSKDASLLKSHLPSAPASIRCAATLSRATDRAAPRQWAGRALAAAALTLLAAASTGAEIDLPKADPAAPIVVTAEAANRFTEGDYEVWVLRGNCRIQQGTASASSREAVLWVDNPIPAGGRKARVLAYMQGDVAVSLDQQEKSGARLTDTTWLGRLATTAEVRIQAARVAGKPDVMPDVYQRGSQHRHPIPVDAVRRTQYTQPTIEPTTAGSIAAGPTATGSETAGSLPYGMRRISAVSRSDVGIQAQWFPSPGSDEWVAVIDRGVNLVIEGNLVIDRFGLGEIYPIDVTADRLVIWTVGPKQPNLIGGDLQPENVPLEIYMEGNIVFRQGDRKIYASRMYYNVTGQVGTVLDAEMFTPVPSYEGMIRLRAEVLQKTGPTRFLARNSFLTSSRMGRPGYRIQSGEIVYEDFAAPAFDPVTGQPLPDLATGNQQIDHRQMATSSNNFLFLGDVPVFYWPTLATDLEDPTFYIRRARLKNDRVFGAQLLTNFDGYELLGIREPLEGTDWDMSLDYLSDRGLGHGTTFLYDRPGFLGIPGRAAGLADFWGIEDRGFDNLGDDRRRLAPAQDYRYRLFWQHRQELPRGLQLSGELGWISDRNFLEQYYEREWDELKDQTTGVELKQTYDNLSWSLSSDARLNPFFTQTEWLPRADHFWLGQSLLGDRLTWYEHSSAGYARFRTASTPTDANDLPFDLLPWELQGGRRGERLVTRQEIDWPLQLGPVKLVPFALGELAHWGEDRSGEDLQRYYWQAGLRASLPMWRSNSYVENRLLNVHGLAHKVVFDAEFSVAESNRDLSQLPLYDPLDDDSVEAFRRRLSTNTFGLPQVPLQFDSRGYALRTGMAGWVTAPSTEIADDLTALRLGMAHRWQTKRGIPGSRRIIDWIVLDTNATVFPEQTRDNFGEALGLVDYDFRWHVGDRLTLLSDGVFDFFQDGQQVVTFGGFLSRPPRGSLYVGLRLLEGPISNQILSMSYTYRMSPKWLSTFGTSIDLGDEGNIGQRFAITRVGESLLISAGFTVDAARNNVGVSLAIEPRFLPKNRLGDIGGARIPVAGAFGLD